MSPRETLSGQVAFVTGAGRGLGAEICRALASDGVHIVAADLERERADSIAAELSDGARCLPLELDVGDRMQVCRAVQTALDKFKRLDILINNAGTDVTKPVERLEFDEFDRIVRTNLIGPFILSKSFFPILRRAGGGHIINIVSTAALRAWASASAYHASKWGLLGLTRALHVEGREIGIKVTAVIAGGMRTPFLLDRFPDLNPDVLQAPQNVAQTVRFLLTQPKETVIPEIMVLPMRETSWP
jgi:NAD(P)-dependent dehydrogenase (short-subunit alcohol dehydrogenase family)